MENNDKMKALDLAISQIDRQFGKGSVMRLGDSKKSLSVPFIHTGSITLDRALGIGGIPRGRVVELYGPESSGKTTLALHIIAEAQKAGGIAAFIDAEHAMDAKYARALGVKIEDLLVSQPAIDVIVIDSVAALVPRAEIEGEMGDAQMGLQARLMSQALRKLTGAISKSQTSVVFINQIRMKIGVMFGNPETTTGGKALKFYSTIRMDIRRIGAIKEGTEMIGNKTRVKVVKNKIAPPFKEAEFDIMYGTGISKSGELVDLGADLEIIEKSGTWYSYGEDRIGQGRENVKRFLMQEENKDIRDKIEKTIRQKLGLIPGDKKDKDTTVKEEKPKADDAGE